METLTNQIYASEEISELAERNPEFMEYLQSSVETYLNDFDEMPEDLEATLRKYRHDAGTFVIATLKKKFTVIMFEDQLT